MAVLVKARQRPKKKNARQVCRLHPSKREIKVHCIYKAGETVYTYYDFDDTTSLSKHSDRDQC